VPAALELLGIRKTWDGFALGPLSIELPRGSMMGIVGPNGAGKTTLLKLVLDLVRPDAGTLRVLGEDPRAAGPRVRSRIGFVHERPTCFEHLCVERVARIVAGFYEDWDAACFQRLLRDFELPARRRVSALSRGMRTKFALAVALSHRAELLLLDEPTGGLDPVFRRELLERLSALVAHDGRSVLFSTQIPSDLERVADYVTLLRDGELLYTGPKDELLDRWAVVRGGDELRQAGGDPSVRGVRATRMGAEMLTDDIEAARQRWAATAVVERATLDDVLLLLGAGRRGASTP